MVKRVNLKSNSLPLGVAMADMAGNLSSRSPSDSDISDDEAESSPQRGHHGHVHNGHVSHHLHHHHHAPVRKKRSETLDSLYSESNSDSSSEDDKMPPILQSIPDDPYDDVFQDVEIDMGSEVDSKLIDWAFNVFVPACCTLLGRCAEMKAEKEKESSSDGVPASPGTTETLSDCIQSDLRNLSNTINYFCSEQQRLSGLLKAKISASISTDRMSKIAIDRASTLQARQTSSNTSSFSDASSGASGYESHDSTADRSYAVKILRSVSQSLIAPLLHEAEDGFTDELYKSIIQALQKISWKVEACLTFNDPSKDNEIHAKIFNSERAPTIRCMMIGALPPEEPKLYASATNASRSNSVSSPKRKPNSSSSLSPVDRPDVSRIIRRTPSGRRRPEGTIFDVRKLPDSLKAVSGGSSAASNEGAKGVIGGDGDKTPLIASVETTPTTPHRARTATTSELEISPSRRGRFTTQTSTEKATHYSDDFDEDFSQHYFRPKAARRTTISLSRKEVTKLGLTVAKRVEESIIPEVSSICESNEGDLHNPTTVLTEDDIRQRLHDTLTKEFDQINESSKSRSYFDRVRSASMSDLLEDNFDSKTPPRRHDSFQGLPEGHPLDSRTGSIGTLGSNDDIVSVSSARIEQSYVPAYHQHTTSSADTSCESEWVFINRPDIMAAKDPRFNRQSSIQSEPGTPHKRDKKLKHKSKNMDKVKRTLTSSMNTSGKFTDKLKKTAQALRRGSIVSSKPKKFERVRVKSMDLLNEAGGSELEQVSPLKMRPKSSHSGPPSPIPARVQKSDSMPHSASKKHKSLKRFVSKKKSFGSKDTKSLGRKGKSEFLQNYETEMERECRLSFTESIENYSKIAVKPKATEGE
jgi:DNA-binding ferritin-like protein